jgi:hypothetical protein
LGQASPRYVTALLYQVEATDPALMAVPIATMLVTAMFAAIRSVLRAIRIDRSALLRSE